MKKRVSLAASGLVAALALVAAGCGGGDDGGETLKIVSDLPLQGSNLVQTGQMVEAIEYVLEQADNKAGDYTIEFESFDDAIASTGNWDEALCASNARTYLERRVGRRRHRDLQLGLRGDHHGDPQRGSGRDGQPGEHVRGPDALRPRAPSPASRRSTSRRASATTFAWSPPTTSRVTSARPT